jgi:hypothetical protein
MPSAQVVPQNLRAKHPESLPRENFEVIYADGIAVGTDGVR